MVLHILYNIRITSAMVSNYYTLKKVNSFPYLVIHMDEKLSWKTLKPSSLRMSRLSISSFYL